MNRDFHEYFQRTGLLHESSCSQTPQQNGVAERKNRHILETARALLIGSNTPGCHWDDAVASAVYLMNRMPSKVLDFNTPLQVLSKHVTLPSLLLIKPRIFGDIFPCSEAKHREGAVIRGCKSRLAPTPI